jgi:Rab proteins geranylgeranyltransferase component A
VKQYSHEDGSDEARNSVFGGAHIETTPTPNQLSPSLMYSMALAPQVIYTDSKLLQALVSSKTYRQLEFLAMGTWWIYSRSDNSESSEGKPNGKLIRVPTSREDVAFADSSIDLRSKRLVMKVLRFVMEYEDQSEIWEAFRTRPFVDFLTQHFKLTPLLVDLFLGLSLTTAAANDTLTQIALPRVARHLRSIGRLGPGFSSVIPKWGGLSEVVQVACRAGAVGGSIYMLGTGIEQINQNEHSISEVNLTNGDVVTAKAIVGSFADLPRSTRSQKAKTETSERLSRSIFIISSPLTSLFPTPAEGAPSTAGSVVIFPSGIIRDLSNSVYFIIHSSETGECPAGQSKSLFLYIYFVLHDEPFLNTYLHSLKLDPVENINL